ncbi:hypothetical protein Asp14428_76350 [Actinoplanes sp. NBRC 14428]|nr:hypothetical protein Asp14428_76350 [Actinoplanes sp. NBRC 14428]
MTLGGPLSFQYVMELYSLEVPAPDREALVSVLLWFVVLAGMVLLFRSGRRPGHFLLQVCALLTQHAAMLALLWSVHSFRVMAITQTVVLLCDALAILCARHGRHEERPPRRPSGEADDGLTEQRHQLARDLHDTIGNNLTIISLYARMGRRMPAEHQLARIDETAQQTMDHVGRILHDLRNGKRAEGRGPTDVGEAVRRVVAEVRDVVPGVRICLTGDVRPVEARTMTVACRVIREALVNAAKHGVLHDAVVHIAVDDQLTVQVITRARRGLRRPVAAGMSLGFGLRGLAEEVESVEGEFRSGPGDNGRYEVAVRIPLRTYPAPTTLSERRDGLQPCDVSR